MTDLRRVRQTTGLSQSAFANLLGVPLNTLRMWDSGLRTPPADLLVRAQDAVATQRRQHELLSLDVLGAEFGMHQRTLRDAVRAGRLAVQFSTRSAFGRPVRLTTRAAVSAYQQQYYRRSYSRTMPKPPKLTRIDVPPDYGEQITLARHALRMTGLPPYFLPPIWLKRAMAHASFDASPASAIIPGNEHLWAAPPD